MPRRKNATPPAETPPAASPGPAKHRWPATEITMRPVASLVHYASNPLEHTTDQVAAIAASMRRYGWTVPVLVDEEGVLIAGHGRLLAAASIGWTEAPTMVARGWSEEDKRAYRIADNQLGRSSDWLPGILQGELLALQEVDYDLDLLGFPAEELELRLNPPAEDEPSAPRGSRASGGGDPLKATIFVTVAPGEKDRAAGVIARALKRAGIAHNL